ncbi:SubName: Full=Related to HRD1-involved in degradation of Hmg2p {ECO:0000313/EMBL:CCA67181.1} [Serendipita indica DSM 11827]|uniref:RING-type E3 ubiquitin transferase n=1 Tax=Serendipita indica (strain DSM 11827) TaxID=1109443 RepID=G4T740_SERID|nr:SubName: Full=Related to HRD1-involved in degradation of Hmg2p {ECO:0000313/EMBL:CCA67181.1} [Serendipita indica DSM 11827]CCA67181.1 related to HRD1-involved in degradation of Hmg2p [Serendipita indica DSM 11827]
MAGLLGRAPPIVYYTAVSAALLGIVVARALDTYHNFYAAAFSLSQSNGSVLVMSNMALLTLYLFGRMLQFIFFGQLRPQEIERLYSRGGFFVTDFMLAFATFREAFGISSGVMVAVLLFAKCFHWLLADRIEAIDQLPYPGPKRLEHARLIALFFTLWIFDTIMFTYTVDAAFQKGIGLTVLFAAEYAILLINLAQSVLKYLLTMIDIRRAANIGGATAPPWEDKPIYSFYIELSTAFVELSIYLTYFTLMSIYDSIPVYAIRDVYVAGSLFFSRSLAFIRYKRAMRALDVFPTPTYQELASKSDNTCIVCREELHVPPPTPVQGASPIAPTAQPTEPVEESSNGPPKKLPCGHIFHLNCLRSWFERQLTCPTCRRRVDEAQPRAPGGTQNPAGGQAGAARNNGLDAARQPPAAGGAAGNPRRAANNPAAAGGPADAAVPPLREPLRFEGFFLMPGAFIPWLGGPILVRDPTAPLPPPARPNAGPQQRTRPPNVAPSNLGASVTTAPSTPSHTATPSTSTVFNIGTPSQLAASNAPAPSTEGSSSTTKSSVSEDDDTSSESSTSEVGTSIEERRRIAAEAALRRNQAINSRGLPSTPSTPTPTQRPAASPFSRASFPRPQETEQAEEYRRYFATSVDLSSPTMKANVPLHPSRVANSPNLGQYHIRPDAPAFVPLFHNFHQPLAGSYVGPTKPWPTLTANGGTQTLPFPQPNSLSQYTHATAGITHPPSPSPGMIRGGTFPRPSTPTHLPLHHSQPGPSGLSHQRGSISFRPGEMKRESSPSQELTTQQLDIITRLQVEERLKVLENVKRMTQQCIDDLLAVRGTIPAVDSLRARSTDTRSTAASESSGVSELPLRVKTESVPPVLPGSPPMPSQTSSLASVTAQLTSPLLVAEATSNITPIPSIQTAIVPIADTPNISPIPTPPAEPSAANVLAAEPISVPEEKVDISLAPETLEVTRVAEQSDEEEL